MTKILFFGKVQQDGGSESDSIEFKELHDSLSIKFIVSHRM